MLLTLAVTLAVGCDRDEFDGARATGAIEDRLDGLPVGFSRQPIALADLTDFEWSAVRITGPFSPYEFPIEFRRPNGEIERSKLVGVAAECFAGLGWIPREKARFRVFVHRYQDDGSFYRLLVPTEDVPGAKPRRCLRENEP